MAEDALRRLEDQLKCLVCLERYCDPKVLKCGHVFCRDCLQPLVTEDKLGRLNLPCPSCHRVVCLPANGMAGLRPALRIKCLQGVVQEHSKTTDSILYCNEHQDYELQQYCNTCQKVVCQQCAFSQHRGHQHFPASAVVEKSRQDTITILKIVEQQLMAVSEAKDELDYRCTKVLDQQASLEGDINTVFDRILDAVEDRRMKLIDSLYSITEKKLCVLESQRDQVSSARAQLGSYVDLIRDSLCTGSEGKVVQLKKSVEEDVKELSSTFGEDLFTPSTNVDVVFSASPDITKIFLEYGSVVATGLPDPMHCHITEGLRTVNLGDHLTATVEAVNRYGKRCTKPVLCECELTSNITNSVVIGTAVQNEEGLYQLTCRPVVKGKHQLHVRIEGEAIRGSPYGVEVILPEVDIGSHILTIKSIEAPKGIVVSRQREIVVTEMSLHCVSVFNLKGVKLRSFGTRGSFQGQFDSPYGVALDNAGNILVTDLNNHRIQKFTSQGKFVAAVGSRGKGPLQFQYPTCIAFNAASNKIVIVDKNHRIQILKSDLSHHHTFGRHGNGVGQFSCPRGVACDASGKIYVADSDNHRIQVFTAEGLFLMKFGQCGENTGDLNWPYGIAVDACGRIYISEFRNHRISVFNASKFLTYFGKKGRGPREFQEPRSLAVDSDGVLYVCDTANNRVQLF